LAEVSMYDANNTTVNNPDFQNIYNRQIAKGEEALIRADEELGANHPLRTIFWSAKAWLHGQIAIKLAEL
ncbi:MAG: hypothetical protein ACFFDN_30510, partial [Candidatus Hodarchaeota archaeon]